MLPYNAGNELHVTIPSRRVSTTEILVETRFAELRCGMKESATGVKEMWYGLKTRPAFEVALLRKLPNQEPEIVLIVKRRLDTDNPKPKLPGGYYDDSADTMDFRIAKVFQDCGIKADHMQFCGQVIGHSEIQTPIDLYCTNIWNVVAEPRPGIEVHIVPLSQAVELAMQGGIDNDSSFSLIMRVYYLHQQKKLFP
jgi:hypothetical protein